jgi:succinyldiaminopimelate transaminase
MIEPGRSGFRPPPYPYDRLDQYKSSANAHVGGLVDLSVGAPIDPPPAVVKEALATVSHADEHALRSYPSSAGSVVFQQAAIAWMRRRLGVEVPLESVAACVGTKEFVTSVPQWLHLRTPERDIVLYPAVSYPSYAMGALLAGCRAVAVPVDANWRIDVSAISEADAARALCLWVNTPGNPAGGLDDLGAIAAWGRAHGIPVFSDECYVEYTWDGPSQTILTSGLEGVVAVHSLSKRSNAAGLRAGFYAGDAELVHYLSGLRKHVGLMVPGPVQAAAVAALGDDDHVVAQRARYHQRLTRFREILTSAGVQASMPGGGFYLWAAVPGGDAWVFTEWLATTAGCLVSPGDFYGEAGRSYVRAAMVQPLECLEVVADRLSIARSGSTSDLR